MTEDMTDQAIEAMYQEVQLAAQEMSSGFRLFIEDMAMAICHVDNCEYKMDQCRHKRLAVDLMRAVTDYHARLLDQNDQKAAANILRSQV